LDEPYFRLRDQAERNKEEEEEEESEGKDKGFLLFGVISFHFIRRRNPCPLFSLFFFFLLLSSHGKGKVLGGSWKKGNNWPLISLIMKANNISFLLAPNNRISFSLR